MLLGRGWSRLLVVMSRLGPSALTTDELGALANLHSLGFVPIFALPTVGSTDPGALLIPCVCVSFPVAMRQKVGDSKTQGSLGNLA